MTNSDAASSVTAESPTRSCGSCMLCCKVFPVEYFDKPAGKWCVHSRPGTGCTIHATRPEICRNFFCEWILNPALDENWRPEKAKFVVYRRSENQYTILVDAAAPLAWKDPKFYPTIKLIAADLIEHGGIVLVKIGNRGIVVLPDRDEDLGIISENTNILVVPEPGPNGPRFTVKIAAK